MKIVIVINLFQSIQVAKSIKVVMTSRSATVVISLDMERIQDAHLNIDAHTVKESILRTAKLKLKAEVNSESCNYDTLFHLCL